MFDLENFTKQFEAIKSKPPTVNQKFLDDMWQAKIEEKEEQKRKEEARITSDRKFQAALIIISALMGAAITKLFDIIF